MLNKCPTIVGNNPEIVKIREMIPELSRSSETVLLKGEKGTGKELIAKVIQHKSARAKNPFIKVNCSALSNQMSEIELLGRNVKAIKDLKQRKKGIFSVADTGTLFFNEIGQLPPAYQAELMILKENLMSKTMAKTEEKVDVRVIASTSTDLESLVRKGAFLQKLYYRLNAVSIIIPPLRYRLEDIPFIADFFTDKYCAELGKKHFKLSQKTKSEFFNYHWPGNILELENLVKGAVALGNEDHLIFQHKWKDRKNEYTHNFNELTDIKKHKKSSGDLPLKDICREIIAQAEQKLLKQALEKTNWNRKKAAMMLHISYKSLLNKIKAYNLT
ncbi:MAG: sigma 54-interacting transcriptional regulator [Thermodesulfobacteriota bacterium]|nr:sigma 54-interacting transcriptional regulator [Thermodesulfobacteriota bacterium]